MEQQGYAMRAELSKRTRFWRALGFRYRMGDDPTDPPTAGWMCTEIHFKFGWLDRARLLLTGRLDVTLISHTDTASPTAVKTRTDFYIRAPGDAP